MTKAAHVADTHPQPDGQKGKKDLGIESRIKVSDTEKGHLHGNPVDNGLKQVENPPTIISRIKNAGDLEEEQEMPRRRRYGRQKV